MIMPTCLGKRPPASIERAAPSLCDFLIPGLFQDNRGNTIFFHNTVSTLSITILKKAPPPTLEGAVHASDPPP
jgi:hypothetical protein